LRGAARGQLGLKGHEQVFRRLSPEALASAANALEDGRLGFVGSIPPRGYPTKGAAAEQPSYGIRRVAPKAFRALRAYGRERRATVTDVLLAAFFRAVFDVEEGARMSFSRLHEFASQQMSGGSARLIGRYALTSFGVLDRGLLSFGDVTVRDAYVASPIVPPGALVLGASTFADTLTLTVGYFAASSKTSDAERFLGLMLDEIPPG